MNADPVADARLSRRPAGRPGGAAAAPRLPWLKTLRAEARRARRRADACRRSRDEAWRFTDISPLTQQSFHPLQTRTALQPADIERFCIAEAATRLVFVDGVYAPQLSSVPTTPSCGRPRRRRRAAQRAATRAASRPPRRSFATTLFAALNTAFLHDAALVIVPRDTRGRRTACTCCSSRPQPERREPPAHAWWSPSAGSAVTVIEDYVALHDGAYFTNAVTEIVVGRQRQGRARARAAREQRRPSTSRRCAVSLGACEPLPLGQRRARRAPLAARPRRAADGRRRPSARSTAWR